MIGLRSKRIIADTTIYIILLVMVVIWWFPLIWMIFRALDMTEYTGVATPTLFPTEFGFANFKVLFTDADYPYGKWFFNTFIIAICSCVISTLFVLMVSYALSRLRFKARKKLMNISLVLGLFPGFLSLVALYFVFNQFGLTGNNSHIALVLAYSLASGTGYYIVKGFFDTVPMAIDEAARIDGASKNRIFWQMIIPLSKPIIIYTILTNFIGPWCDFIMASLFLGYGTSQSYTVAVGLQKWLQQGTIGKLFTRFCAGGVFVSVPIVILYMIMQKFYVSGITGGAAKG